MACIHIHIHILHNYIYSDSTTEDLSRTYTYTFDMACAPEWPRVLMSASQTHSSLHMCVCVRVQVPGDRDHCGFARANANSAGRGCGVGHADQLHHPPGRWRGAPCADRGQRAAMGAELRQQRPAKRPRHAPTQLQKVQQGRLCECRRGCCGTRRGGASVGAS